MNEQYKYKLDPSSKKYNCPSCSKKTMVAYVYADTNATVDAHTFGRCDRESNCQYHHHPGEDKEFTPDHKIVPVLPPIIEQIFPPSEVVERLTKRTKTCTSNLHAYMRGLGISNDHLLEWGVYSEDNEKTAFVLQNIEGRVCNIKYFAYGTDGHRSKEIKAYSLRQPKTPSSPPPTPPNQKKSSERKIALKYLLPIFGAHLLDKTKKKTVCVVESEKTAVMASFFYRDFDWVSCGSASGLGVSEGVPGDFKIKDLFGRKIYWLADADKAGRKNSSIELLNKYEQDVTIIDLHPELDNGHDLGDDIDAGVRPAIKPAAKIAEHEAYKYDLPDGVEFDDVKWDIFKYSHFEHKNRVYMVRPKSDENVCKAITNFSIKSLGLVLSRANPRRLLMVKNVHNHEQILEVPTKAFASQTEFTVFVESNGNYQYNGIGTDLKKLRSRLYDTMPSYEEVTALGWHREGYFVWANGIYNGKFKPIDKYGFVKMGKANLYVEPLSCLNDTGADEWEDERKFVYNDRKDVTLKQWADLYCEVHKDNGVISIAWFITSLFRDFVYKNFKFFPHWFGFGPPGTGKSQVGWSVRAMGFDAIKKPFNLSGGTKVAFHREFSHFINFPCWFDEYDNSIDYDRVQSLKAAYDGSGHKKSVKDSDNRTKTVPVNSSAMITGQQLPIADNALFKRVILCQFHQTSFTTEEVKLFKELQIMEDGGLTGLTSKLLHLRKVVEREYMDTFDIVQADFFKNAPSNAEIEDRIMRNMCMIATTVRLMDKHMPNTLPYNYEEFRKIALKNVLEQMALISNANETNAFWDMVSYLIDRGLVSEGNDLKFKDTRSVPVYTDGNTTKKEFDKTKKVVYVRMSSIIPLYRKHFKEQNTGNASAMDKGSLLHYLQHQKYYIGAVKNVKFEKAQTSAYAFDNEIMEAHGIELRRGSEDVNAPEDLTELVNGDKKIAKF